MRERCRNQTVPEIAVERSTATLCNPFAPGNIDSNAQHCLVVLQRRRFPDIRQVLDIQVDLGTQYVQHVPWGPDFDSDPAGLVNLGFRATPEFPLGLDNLFQLLQDFRVFPWDLVYHNVRADQVGPKMPIFKNRI